MRERAEVEKETRRRMVQRECLRKTDAADEEPIEEKREKEEK